MCSVSDLEIIKISSSYTNTNLLKHVSQTIIDHIVKHRWCMGQTKGQNLILKMTDLVPWLRQVSLLGDKTKAAFDCSVGKADCCNSKCIEQENKKE